MEAAVYARISKDRTGEGLGVDRQVEACRAKAAEQGWTVGEIYRDDSLSASKSVTRPAYERLMADIKSDKVKALVVYDLDRLTRKPLELEQFMLLVEETGLNLVVKNGDVVLTTGNDRFMARVRGNVARLEADRIAERTREQKEQRALSGKPLGTRFRTFGYTHKTWEIVPAEAEIVREVFARAATGESRHKISADLRARGVLTVTGGPWLPLQTSRMLRTHRYAGLATYKGKVVGKSEVPAIISEPEFEAAQRPGVKASHGNARRYLLSGFVVCGSCMAPMTGGNGRYRCDVGMGGCAGVSIKAEAVDVPVSRRVTAYHQQTRMGPAEDAPDHKADLEAADAEIKALLASYDRGEIKAVDATPLLNSARKHRDAIVKAAAADVTFLADTFRGMDEWDAADLGAKRQIVGRYVGRILIAPSGKGRQPSGGLGRIEVHWTNDHVENLLTAPVPALQWWS